jgi:hypothetical protein
MKTMEKPIDIGEEKDEKPSRHMSMKKLSLVSLARIEAIFLL